MAGGKHVLTVAAGDPDTLLALLVQRLGLEPSVARGWLIRGAVQVNGTRAAADVALPSGSRIVVREPPPEVDEPLRIVYSDEELLVVDKPAGLLAQPSPGESDSLETRITRQHPKARLAHRLDRDTSGLVIFTLAPAAHAALQQSLVSGAVHREYQGVCGGRLEGVHEVHLRIAPDPADRSRRRALPPSASGGQAAHTHIERLADASRSGLTATLFAATLDTGRTHQIRVHLAAIGHPVLGDRLYGGPPAPRLLLHAVRLAFPHPASRMALDLRSATPDGFRT